MKRVKSEEWRVFTFPCHLAGIMGKPLREAPPPFMGKTDRLALSEDAVRRGKSALSAPKPPVPHHCGKLVTTGRLAGPRGAVATKR